MGYDLRIPKDEHFFNSVLYGSWKNLNHYDLRLVFKPNPYQKWKISDKGQYLRVDVVKQNHTPS